MTPTIEQIVEDVLAGLITKSQAVTWLHAHAGGAASDLRDHFAGLAMQAMVTKSSGQDATGGKKGVPLIAQYAYEYADSMLAARGA